MALNFPANIFRCRSSLKPSNAKNSELYDLVIFSNPRLDAMKMARTLRRHMKGKLFEDEDFSLERASTLINWTRRLSTPRHMLQFIKKAEDELHLIEGPERGFVARRTTFELADSMKKKLDQTEVTENKIRRFIHYQSLRARTTYMKFSNNGRFLASGSDSSLIIIWEVNQRGEWFRKRTLSGQKKVTAVAWSSDDQLLTASEEAVMCWNIHSGECLNVYGKFCFGTSEWSPDGSTYSCVCGVNEEYIASGSKDSMVYIRHRDTGELKVALEGHSGPVICVSWNQAKPHVLASASEDATILIWGLNSVFPSLKEK
ncbi:hypothetical protein V6N13_145505 [Hibiscus sabdariffa]|uniref:Uncharacterized protein n=1 Tax=Hibiscus sabdariffa TaxID=183260 RepID=A0ABR2TQ42_9ROSI